MANSNKGEVAVKVGETTYTLVFSANAMCEVEERLGRPWLDIAMEINGWLPQPKVDDLGKPVERSVDDLMQVARRVKTSLLRTLVWGGLREHHEGMSIKDAGRLMDRLSPAEGGALGLITKLFARSMPEAESDQGETANPPKPDSPRGGTGPAS